MGSPLDEAREKLEAAARRYGRTLREAAANINDTFTVMAFVDAAPALKAAALAFEAAERENVS